MANQWRIHTLYDESAYRALAEACWQLFRKPRMQTQVYPVLFAVSVITLIAALMSDEVRLLPAMLLIAFFLAAIPLGKISAKAKMYRTAVKAGDSFPARVDFVFTDAGIRATMAARVFDMPYQKVFCFAALSHWRFIFFDATSAYIINTADFQDQEDLHKFEAMIEKRCSLSMIPLKAASA